MTRADLVALHDSLRTSAAERFAEADRERGAWLDGGRRQWREAMKLEQRADAIAARLTMMDDGPGIMAEAFKEVVG